MPDLPYALSALAEQDLAAIARYTLETWGERQLERYRSLLNHAFLDLSRDPEQPRAKPRPELFEGCRSYHAGKHLILYRINGGRLEIARVLHESMELERHLFQFPSSADEIEE